MAVSPLGGQILVKEGKPQGFSEDPVPEGQIFPVFRASAGDFQHGGAAAQAGHLPDGAHHPVLVVGGDPEPGQLF